MRKEFGLVNKNIENKCSEIVGGGKVLGWFSNHIIWLCCTAQRPSQKVTCMWAYHWPTSAPRL